MESPTNPVCFRFHDSVVVEPVHPVHRRLFHILYVCPFPVSVVDDLRLVESIDRFRESIVVAIAHTSNRCLDPGVFEAGAVFHAEVLDPTVAMVNEALWSAVK